VAHALLLGAAAALGTITGLFLGMPIAGFLLWPVTRALCRAARVEIDLHDEDDPILKLESSVAAGLGMALGVAITVLVVGLISQAPRVGFTAVSAGGMAGLAFGSLWRYGYARESAAPLVLGTALVAAIAAALTA